MTKRVTLITGASSGIGAQLASVFSENGHRVALVGRRAERLEHLARQILDRGAIRPIVIPCDLEQVDAGVKIEAALVAEGVEIEYLVNSAGYGIFGDAADRDFNEQLGMIAVNVRTLTDLCLRFTESLIRNRGGILNVGSIAGFLPGPGMAVYYASKAYVMSLTESLRGELQHQGVRVTLLCPGPVQTEFQARAGVDISLVTAMLKISALEVALAGYRGLVADKPIVLPGIGVKLIPIFLRLFPRSLVLAVARRFQLRKLGRSKIW